MLIFSLERTSARARAPHLSHYKCMPATLFSHFLFFLYIRALFSGLDRKSQEVGVVTAFGCFFFPSACLRPVHLQNCRFRDNARRKAWRGSDESALFELGRTKSEEERIRAERGNNNAPEREREDLVCVHSLYTTLWIYVAVGNVG